MNDRRWRDYGMNDTSFGIATKEAISQIIDWGDMESLNRVEWKTLPELPPQSEARVWACVKGSGPERAHWAAIDGSWRFVSVNGVDLKNVERWAFPASLEVDSEGAGE